MLLPKGIALLILLFANPAYAAIALDTNGAGTGSASSNTLTISGIVVNASSEYLLIHCWDSTGTNHTMSSPKFNGTAMTVVTTVSNWHGDATHADNFSYDFGLANPSTGTNSFTVTTSGASDGGWCQWHVYTGVNQATPTDGSTSSDVQNTSGNKHVTLTPTGSSEVMVTFTENNQGGVGNTLTNAGNINTLYNGAVANDFSRSGDTLGAGSTPSSGVAFTQTWTQTNNTYWGDITGVLLKVSSGGGSSAPALPPQVLVLGNW